MLLQKLLQAAVFSRAFQSSRELATLPAFHDTKLVKFAGGERVQELQGVIEIEMAGNEPISISEEEISSLLFVNNVAQSNE